MWVSWAFFLGGGPGGCQRDSCFEGFRDLGFRDLSPLPLPRAWGRGARGVISVLSNGKLIWV